MIHITLHPQRRDGGPLTAHWAAGVLTLDGAPVVLAGYDAEAAPSPWIVGQPELVAGVWRVDLILPHGPDAPHETLWPAPVLVEAEGPVALPPYDAAEGA